MLAFSVIVPVFNVKQYLNKCLDGILNQSSTDVELLLVDDGSTDGSGAICDEYAEKDSRVRVFHKENGGVSSARNMGLDNAKGEWVVFVDADDYLCDNAALSKLNKAILTNEDCELVFYPCKVSVYGEDYSGFLEERVYDKGSQCMEDNCLSRRSVVFGSVFVQCFKKSVIDAFQLRFDESISYAEDRLFVCSYYLRAKKTVVLSDVLYCYVVNDSSLMHDENRKKRLNSDQVKSVLLLEKEMFQSGNANLKHLRKYMHGLYVQSVIGLGRKEVDWRFLFRNAVTAKLLVKDLLLFIGINKYK